MAGNLLQIGPDGKLRIKDDKLVVAGVSDPCCCTGACYVKPKKCSDNSEHSSKVIPCPASRTVFKLSGDTTCWWADETFTQLPSIPGGYTLGTVATSYPSCGACAGGYACGECSTGANHSPDFYAFSFSSIPNLACGPWCCASQPNSFCSPSGINLNLSGDAPKVAQFNYTCSWQKIIANAGTWRSYQTTGCTILGFEGTVSAVVNIVLMGGLNVRVTGEFTPGSIRWFDSGDQSLNCTSSQVLNNTAMCGLSAIGGSVTITPLYF